MKQRSKKATGFVFLGNSVYEQWKASKARSTALRPGEPSHSNPADPSADEPYVIFVDDNFHYMDESERYKHGEYTTFEEAVNACQAIVEDSLSGLYEPGMSSNALFDQYVFCGEDPFIRGPKSDFSAWDYAKQRCEALCSQRIVAKTKRGASKTKTAASKTKSKSPAAGEAKLKTVTGRLAGRRKHRSS